MNRVPFLSFPAALVLLASCGGADAPPEEIVRPVRTLTVYSTGAERERSFSGVTQAGVESRLSFRVPGTVVEVAVRVGERVETGDPIARIDDEDYRLQVRETRASLDRALAEQRNAQSSYDRVRALYENNNASRSDLDAARTALESATAQVDAVRNRLELVRLQLGYARLAAPAAGAISAVFVEVNENVNAGTPVATLTSGGRPEVRVSVPEQLILQVREGDLVEVDLDAVPGRTFPARVTEVGVAATGTATTFPVTLRLDEADSRVRPGMAAEARFRFREGDGGERWLVDPYAVSEDADGRFVYVAEPTEPGFAVVRRRAVTVGALTDAGLEVLTGLEDGDRVVTAGITRIQDGLRVRLPDGGSDR